MRERRYYVKVGNLYFKNWEESQYPVFIIDDSLGAKEDADIFDKQAALKVAKEVGGTIEPIEKLYQMPVPYLEKMGAIGDIEKQETTELF